MIRYARTSVTWRFLQRGKVKHALAIVSSPAGHETVALCGIRPAAGHGESFWWWGTGDQGEYERAAELPECSRCIGYLERPMVAQREVAP